MTALETVLAAFEKARRVAGAQAPRAEALVYWNALADVYRMLTDALPALAEVERERDELKAANEAFDSDVEMSNRRLLKERDEARAEVERLKEQQIEWLQMGSESLSRSGELSRDADRLVADWYAKVMALKVENEQLKQERDGYREHRDMLLSKLDDTHTHRCFVCEGTVTKQAAERLRAKQAETITRTLEDAAKEIEFHRVAILAHEEQELDRAYNAGLDQALETLAACTEVEDFRKRVLE